MTQRYRAWDVGAKEFVTDFVLDHTGNEYQADRCEFWGDDRKITVMRSTGLKDMNGVEIYEDDVVRLMSKDYKGVEHECTYKVGIGPWSNGVMEDRLTYVGVHVKGITGPASSWYGDLTEQMADRCEVIGNIHEHPHLDQRT